MSDGRAAAVGALRLSTHGTAISVGQAGVDAGAAELALGS